MLKTFQTLLSMFALTLIAQQASAQGSCSVFLYDSTYCGATQGWIYAYTSGTTGGVSFQWSDGSTGSMVAGTLGSTYSVTITDGTGCTATGSHTLPQPAGAPIVVSHNVVQSGCDPNGLGGIVDLTVSGGVPPFTFYWSNGATTEDVTGITGSVNYSVQDAAGCYVSNSLSLGGIDIYGNRVTESFCNQNNGGIYPFVQGNYTYLWSNGATTASLTGLAAGAYGLTITDPANNCSLRQVYQVGYDPNCESVISGHVYAGTACVPSVSGSSFNSYRYVVITEASTGTRHYVGVSPIDGYYEFRTRVPGTYSLNSYAGSALVLTCPNSGQLTATTTANGGVVGGNDFFFTFNNTDDVNLTTFVTNSRPGFETWQMAYICNEGSNTQNGTLEITYDPTLSYLSSQPYNWNGVPNNQAIITGPTISGNVLTFSYANLLPGECRTIEIWYSNPTNLVMGATTTFYASVTPIVGDATPANNVDTLNGRVVNSYDPNDKQQFNLRKGDSYAAEIYQQDNELEYLIRFQNTGNAPAIRVEVRDTLEANLLLETMRDVFTSHPCVISSNGQNLSFTFNNIYLADSFSNEPASHGFIKFKINRAANLPLQTVIENKAAIYFDFNAPVITNTQTTSIVAEVIAAERVADQIELLAMPNPTKDQLTVQYNLPQSGKVSVSLVNQLGQIQPISSQNQNAGFQSLQISTSELPAGIYHLFIQTENGNYSRKIVKE